MQSIGKFTLRNWGAFAVHLQFVYWDENSSKIHKDGTDAFSAGFSKTADPGEYGIPDESQVALHTSVVAGTQNDANQMFIYKKGSPVTAYYIVAGTTVDNQVGLVSVGP